jgi:hypothetical protein
MLVYRCQHGLAPPYLADELHRATDVQLRQRLRPAATQVVLAVTKHVTIGDCAFPIAAAGAWNVLSPHVASSPSRFVFNRQLKTELFGRPFNAN